MCNVSDNIKLCTCATAIEKLRHYWIFHRFNKDQDDFVIGQPILPIDFDPKDFKSNQESILRQLNEGTIFDSELFPKNKDRLQLSFSCGLIEKQIIDYGFEFRNQEWHIKEFDSLEWMHKHSEENFGKIKNAITRKHKK